MDAISSFDLSRIIQFVVDYKWWIIALIPFAIVISVLRARG